MCVHLIKLLDLSASLLVGGAAVFAATPWSRATPNKGMSLSAALPSKLDGVQLQFLFN